MKKIVIKTKGKTYIININELLYCKASGSYTVIYLVSKEEIVASFNLSKIQAMVNSCPQVLRVGQSILVNMEYVKYIYHAEKELELCNLVKVPFTIPLREMEEQLDKLISKTG